MYILTSTNREVNVDGGGAMDSTTKLDWLNVKACECNTFTYFIRMVA